MRAWQTGNIRLYNPIDIPLPTLISMPGNHHWTILAVNEEPDIVPVHPWIPVYSAIDNIVVEDIPEVDNMYDILASQRDEPYDSRLEHYLRPSLFIDMPLTLVQRQSSFDQMLETAITASLSHHPRTQTSREPRTPSHPSATSFRLPQHVVDIVLSAAEADRYSCPISMEPISKATGAVTSCGHVFQATAIQEWLQSNDTCPECRQPCSV